jgi:hypothetical protein
MERTNLNYFIKGCINNLDLSFRNLNPDPITNRILGGEK